MQRVSTPWLRTRSIMITLVLACVASRVWAHPISMSAVAVNVQEDKILANMKVMLEDLVMYHGLQAGEDQRFTMADLKQAAARHQDFVLQYFTIRNAAGQPVPGQVMRLDTAAIPAAGVLQSELMARNVFYHLVFPLAQRQDFLTFTQTFGGAEAVLPAVMELVTFHNRILLHRPVQLTQGRPHTVRFDWDNPPTGTPQSLHEYQQQQQEEFHRQLGITSYSGLYSFIYITQQEVRHEILIPLLTFEKWLPLARSHPDFIDVAAQQAAQDKIAAFFRERNPVTIDGMAMQPVLTRLQFFGLDINDFARHAEPRRISVYQARLGIILSYATKGAPTQVRLTWETFNDFAPFLRSVVYVYDHDPTIHLFKKDAPLFTWTQTGVTPTLTLSHMPQPRRPPPWSLPMVSIGAGLSALLWVGVSIHRQQQHSFARWLRGVLPFVAIGVLCWPLGRVTVPAPFAAIPQVTEAEARELSVTLLRNIYRAFDYHTESDVYDALAQSVDGQLLTNLYLQVQHGLSMQEQGGAVARVQEVRLVDSHVVRTASNANRLPQLVVQCRWRVTGTVEHWGHMHTRENEYQALLTLSARPDTWKITAYDVLDERRVRFETGLRTSSNGELRMEN